MPITSRWPAFFAIALVFAASFPLFFLAPLQSDDYSYALKGLSLRDTFNHYIGWSGRLVADFASTLVLSSRSKLLIGTVNAVAMVAMIYSITAIAFGKTRNLHFSAAFVVTFLVYWFGNPALGQTTLWTVGAANYLYANSLLCIAIYRLSLVEVHKQPSVNLWLLSVISFLSGIGNENMSVAVGAISIVYIASRLALRHMPSKAVIVATAAYGLGSAVLILSPGNSVRSSFFRGWYDLSLSDRLAAHFFTRVPETIVSLNLALAAFGIAVVLGLVGRKNLKPTALFLVGAVVSVAAMAASPTFGPRSLNPTLILLLIAIVFLLPTEGSIRKLASSSGVLLLVLLPWCVPKLANQYTSYLSLYQQGQIREEILRSGGSEIPAFYTEMLQDVGDGPDRHHSPEAMGKYYGVAPVQQYETSRDYGFDQP